MALKTAQQYVDSLRALKLNAYVGGQKITGSVVDHPAVAPHINTVAKTYELAHRPEHQEVMTAISHLTGERVHRYTHIFQNNDDLVKKIEMLRLLGQVTGTCFQRCVGLDALNSMYAISYECDKTHGTDYHQRFRKYLTWVQQNDLMLAGAMTDPKGHRAKRPAEQADPDQFVRVVERRPDGVVIRGAKVHNTGGINSHEVLVLPGTAMKADEKDFAIACAVPADAPGVVMIFGRQSNDSRKVEGCGMDIGNPRFGVVGGEAMVVFEDVFVPNDRVFLNGEVDQCANMVNYFATWHRANYGGCKGGNADVLIGATAKTTRILGTDKNAVVRDKLIEMVHLTETSYGTAIAASAQGHKLPCGSQMVNPMLANVTKQNITRNIYAVGRLAHDLAGGYLATMPDEASFENPEIAKYVKKYHVANPEYDVMDRVKMGRYIENMTSVTTMVEAMHGAGSPQAQRIVMMSQAGIEAKIKMAEAVIDGKDDAPGLPLRRG